MLFLFYICSVISYKSRTWRANLRAATTRERGRSWSPLHPLCVLTASLLTVAVRVSRINDNLDSRRGGCFNLRIITLEFRKYIVNISVFECVGTRTHEHGNCSKCHDFSIQVSQSYSLHAQCAFNFDAWLSSCAAYL